MLISQQALSSPMTQGSRNAGGPEPRRVGAPIDRRKWLIRLVVVVSLGALMGGGLVYWDRRGPQAPTEIFKGITYGCERLETTEEGSGLVHWVRIDLTAPGIEL